MLSQPISWETIKQFILQSSVFIEKRRPARTGWTDGTLSSSARPNFIKVRYLDDNTQAEVYNESVPLMTDLQVYVYKGLDGVPRARYPSTQYKPSDLWFSFIKNHGPNHSAYSVDPVYVDTRTFLPLRPTVSGTWDITIKPGWVVFGDQAYKYPGEILSVEAYRPGTGARFVLLSVGLVDVDGVITVKMIVTQGTSKAKIVAPADFPKIPAGTHPVCVVRASAKKVKLEDKETGGDIFDLRLTGGGAGSGEGGIVTITTDDSLQGDGSAETPLGIAFGSYEPTSKRLDLFGDPLDTTNFPTAASINAVNQVQEDVNPPRYNLWGFGSGGVIQGFRAKGTKVTPTAITAGNSLFGIVGNGYDGVDFWNAISMGFFASEDWSIGPDKRGTEFRVVITDAGGTANSTMKFGANGLNIPAGKTYDIDGVPHTHDNPGSVWGGITGDLSDQTDLQTALEDASAVAAWGGITGDLSDQTDLQTALNNAGGSGAWGGITGTIGNQTDLQTALAALLKLDLSNAPLTGSRLKFSGDMPHYISIDKAAPSAGGGNALLIDAGDSPAAPNKVGGNLVLRSGKSTGLGASEITFFTPSSGADGSVENNHVLRATINEYGIQSSGRIYGSNIDYNAVVSGNNTGDQSSVSGNAGTATKLATPRAIAGVNFDGSAAIAIPSTGLSDQYDRTAWPTAPAIAGSTTAGVGTYSSQLGFYWRLGKLIFIQVELIWSAHTGTGSMRVVNFPFGFVNSGVNAGFIMSWTGITLLAAGNKLFLNGLGGTSYAAFQEVGSGALTNVPIDTAGSVTFTGCYLAS
jgi:hypothetical protein